MTSSRAYRGPTVLLVEDDVGDAVLVQACLADAGIPDAAVTWARTYAEALQALTAEPGCVLLDLGLPDAGGLPAVRAMSTVAAHAPVIVLTGRQERDGAELLAVGAQDYLVKDALTGDTLERSIRYAVERKRSEESRQALRLSVAERARMERGLLPVPYLLGDSVTCSTYYRPGSDGAVLGGDFFDIVEVEDGTVHAIIGDVMGHGPDEAAVGVHLRVAWRTLRMSGADDATVLPTVSRLLHAEAGLGYKFATACEITLRGAQMTVRLAGHPAPIVVSPDGAAYARARISPPMGVAGLGQWPATTVTLEDDCAVLLYTDGLLDAYTPAEPGASIGVEELVLAAASCQGLPDDAWLPQLITHAPRRASDDVAAVMLSRRPR